MRLAAALVAIVLSAQSLPAASGTLTGRGPSDGLLPLGCAAAAGQRGECQPFVPAAASGRAQGLGHRILDPRDRALLGSGGISARASDGRPFDAAATGTTVGDGAPAGAGGAFGAGRLTAASCSAPECILRLVSAPPARSGGLLTAPWQALLLGCLAMLGALAIRPRA